MEPLEQKDILGSGFLESPKDKDAVGTQTTRQPNTRAGLVFISIVYCLAIPIVLFLLVFAAAFHDSPGPISSGEYVFLSGMYYLLWALGVSVIGGLFCAFGNQTDTKRAMAEIFIFLPFVPIFYAVIVPSYGIPLFVIAMFGLGILFFIRTRHYIHSVI